MSHSTIEYLQHILDEIAYLHTQTPDLAQEAFMHNASLKRAFTRSIEIIGEAVKYMPAELKQKYPHINWRAIAGMRDRLIHGYFDVDYDIVWDVVINKIPELEKTIRQMMQDEGKE
jgi:uncharacterized protein with HEPN domain